MLGRRWLRLPIKELDRQKTQKFRFEWFPQSFNHFLACLRLGMLGRQPASLVPVKGLELSKINPSTKLGFIFGSPNRYTLKQILEEIETIFALREFLPEDIAFPALESAKV